MERALLLVGELLEGEESYQLLIGCNYISAVYGLSSERVLFYEDTDTAFVERILQEKSHLEVGVFNGLRISPLTGNHERIPKLEETLVSHFSDLVCRRLRNSSALTLPVSPKNQFLPCLRFLLFPSNAFSISVRCN